MKAITLFELMQGYLEYGRSLQMSARTLSSYAQRLRAFFRWLEHTFQVCHADQLLPRYIEAWLKSLHAHRTQKGFPLKPGTINRNIESARMFFKYLASRGALSPRLVEACRYVKQPQLLPASVLTHAQVKKFLRRIDTTRPEGQRDRAMFELMYSSGVRVGELLGANVESADLRAATLRVLGKGRKERVVPVGRTALRYLESYLVAVRPEFTRDPSQTALFLESDGQRLRYHVFLRNLHRYADPLGHEFSVTPHTFRRSCTTELIRGGANMYHVKELLGHESLDTLKHYARLTILDLKKTHEKCHPREKD